MKGPTLRELATGFRVKKPTVVRCRQWDNTLMNWWIAVCGTGHHWGAYEPTHAEALAAANLHALEHLVEDVAKWAADGFAAGSELFLETEY